MSEQTCPECCRILRESIEQDTDDEALVGGEIEGLTHCLRCTVKYDQMEQPK